MYDQVIYEKGGKNIQWKMTVSSISCIGKTGATCKRTELAHCCTLYRKINSKWIKDLHVRPETTKLLEEHISRQLLDISLAIHTYIWLWLQIMRLCQTKNLVHSEENYQQSKRQHLNGRTYLQIIFNKGLIVKVYKELTQP